MKKNGESRCLVSLHALFTVMTSAPIRHPGFLILAIALLGGYYVASSRNLVKTMALETIEAQYIAERADCRVLKGKAKGSCDQMADRRQQLAQQKLSEILKDSSRSRPVVLSTSNQ